MCESKHSSGKYVLSTCFLPGFVQGAANTTLSKTALVVCLVRACNPMEKADKPAAARTKCNQWLDRRVWHAQGGEGKEPLKYFRGVAEEAMLKLN